MKHNVVLFLLFVSLSLVITLMIGTGIIYLYKNSSNKSYALLEGNNISEYIEKTSNKVTVKDKNDIVTSPTTTSVTTTRITTSRIINEIKPEGKVKSVTISAVGDCTIGYDTRFNYNGRFDYYYDKYKDYGYYFKKVLDVLSEDDITIINLEGNLTDSNNKVIKTWNYKGPTSYKEVLTNGSIELVSFANNHTHDYGTVGYNDTIEALKSINMDYYGFSNHYFIKDVNGIKIGFFGLLDIYGKSFKAVNNAVNYLKSQGCDLIIASMHWGLQYNYQQSEGQVSMAHYLIDSGVDLVIGHHPHVVQGIEKYHNKFIVYSLGNFVYGGNPNPRDKDTFIWRQTFNFVNDKLALDDDFKIIPAYLSGEKNYNNYQPIILNGEEKKRVINKIMQYSNFSYD